MLCYHPELIPLGGWNQPGLEPTAMIGPCEHHQSCPTCGFGWGCAPDPCDQKAAFSHEDFYVALRRVSSPMVKIGVR